MKNIIVAVFFCILIIQIGTAQDHTPYRDSLNSFSIQIPGGWKYRAYNNTSGLVLIAVRTPTAKDSARDNFNINIINTPKYDLETTFSKFINYLPNTEIQSKGDTVLNGRRFKWLIEKHSANGVEYINYDFVTVRNKQTIILTMVSFAKSFPDVKEMFEKIARSFAVSG